MVITKEVIDYASSHYKLERTGRAVGVMAAANSTTGGNQKRITEMYCSAEFIGEVDSELIFLSVLNSLLSITAFLGNALIQVALHP